MLVARRCHAIRFNRQPLRLRLAAQPPPLTQGRLWCGKNFLPALPHRRRGTKSAVGALRKHAGGMFLASDRSGYAARREVGGYALPHPRQREAPVPPAAIFLFAKRNMEKRKRACGRRIKSALRAVCRVRALTRERSVADFVAATTLGRTGNRFFAVSDFAPQLLASLVSVSSAPLASL